MSKSTSSILMASSQTPTRPSCTSGTKIRPNTGAKNLKIDVPDNSLVDDYHTFGVDLSPQAIVFFRDGKRVWSQPTPPELDGPMYPLVNLALGSGWPIDRTPNPPRSS